MLAGVVTLLGVPLWVPSTQGPQLKTLDHRSRRRRCMASLPSWEHRCGVPSPKGSSLSSVASHGFSYPLLFIFDLLCKRVSSSVLACMALFIKWGESPFRRGTSRKMVFGPGHKSHLSRFSRQIGTNDRHWSRFMLFGGRSRFILGNRSRFVA
jgi:hypothetical protein